MAGSHGKKLIWSMASARSLDKQPDQRRRVWGRRQSRPLSPSRQQVMDDIFPRISIDSCDLNEDGALAPSPLFDTPREIWLEIGFGAGEHVIGLLAQHDDINMLAAEPYVDGVSTFIKDLPEAYMPRVRVLMDDAMMLARSLSDQSIERLYILNPDPWHKKRHHKRRIVSPDNLDVFARILKPGGQLIMSSDVPDMADWMVTHAYQHPDFDWNAEHCADWSQPPADWITTRYEVKGAKGARVMTYLFFTRK